MIGKLSTLVGCVFCVELTFFLENIGLSSETGIITESEERKRKVLRQSWA